MGLKIDMKPLKFDVETHSMLEYLEELREKITGISEVGRHLKGRRVASRTAANVIRLRASRVGPGWGNRAEIP